MKKKKKKIYFKVLMRKTIPIGTNHKKGRNKHVRAFCAALIVVKH